MESRAPSLLRDPLALVRDEPFRLFFPLAFLLGTAGISHWVLFTTGAIPRYLGVFHAVTQMQSFMLAFAAGFLMTAIPKRTRSAPASLAEIAALALLLPTVSLAELFDLPILSQAAYAGSLLVLAQFAFRRFASRSAGRRPPSSFVLVPMGLLAGLVGAALLIGSSVAGTSGLAHAIGRALVFEGVFLCLALGVGGFFISLALRGEPPPDLGSSPRERLRLVAYAILGALALGSLILQARGFTRLGPLVRAGAAIAVFASAGGLHLPTRPGWNRLLLWGAAWAIPAGLIAAAIFPAERVAAMHVHYLGGLGVLAFAVAAHVTLGHTGFGAHQDGFPRPVLAFGLLFVLALLFRLSAAAFPQHYFGLLGTAAALWLAAALTWAAYLVPKMWTGKALASPIEQR